MAGPTSPEYLVREIPLNGRLRTNVDPATIGPSDFQTLKNMRYGKTSPKGIAGQTKINTAALSNVKIKNGIHYRKDFPSSESHVLVSAQDANGANPNIYRNSAAIPAQGAFTSAALFNETAGGSIPQFDVGPDGKVLACNGKDTLIWGGSEMPVAKLLDWDATTNTYKYDWTEQVSNNLTDANNIATLHRVSNAIDSATMLLLHFDNNVTDAASRHIPTNTNVTFGNPGVFGTHYAVFNGTNAQIEVADSSDFNFSGGMFTWEARIYPANISGTRVLFHQQTDAANYIRIFLNAGVPTLNVVSTGPVTEVSLIGSSALSVDTWYHLAVVESGDGWYMFLNGALAGYVSDVSRAANYTGSVYIGSSGGANYFVGSMDEMRVSNSDRWTSAFTSPITAYGTGNITNLYVSSTLPLESVKFYVGTANTGTGTMTGYYWSGAAWTPVSSLSDGTAVAGKSLAQTGTVSFTSTVSTAKLKSIASSVLYWYKFEITECDTTTTLTQVTCSAAMQQLKDIWDGEFRSVGSFQLYQSSQYKDYTTNVFENSFDLSNDATVAKIASFTAASDHLVVGFTQRMSGLTIGIVGTNVNTATSVSTVSYYNGASYTALTTKDDQTVSNNCSLGQSGMVLWDAPAITSEHKTRIAGAGTQSADLYYYKITFSGNWSSNVWIYYIGGIPVQETVKGWEMPVSHAGRLFLLANTDTRPDAYRITSYGTSQVLNGADTTEDYFGDGLKPVAAASIVSRYGAQTSSILIVPNEQRTYGVFGDTLDEFKVKVIAEYDGCNAPLTMDVASVPDFALPGRGKKVAIWQSQRGIVMSDGNPPILISEDIEDKFDPLHANYVGASNLPNCQGSIDPVKGEYHWFLPDGTEWVCDLTVVKDSHFPWYQVNRGAKDLTGALTVTDANGVVYHYGYDDAGFLYRLENGTTFDGVGIAQQFRLGDLALEQGAVTRRSEVRGIRVITKSKATTAQTIAVTHYADGSTSGTSLSAIDPSSANRFVKEYRSIGSPPLIGVFHNLDLSITTTDETCGFEPLFLGYIYKDLGLETR